MGIKKPFTAEAAKGWKQSCILSKKNAVLSLVIHILLIGVGGHAFPIVSPERSGGQADGVLQVTTGLSAQA